jgi:hypothetical protein
MQTPSAIILVNDTVTLDFLNTLHTDDSPSPSTIVGLDTQLDITETISFDEFNTRVANDPNYPATVHLNHLRLLVILTDFQDTTNRELFDIVLFVKNGLASVLKCKFGPPGLTLDIQRLNIFNLINGLRGNNVCCVPFPGCIQPPQTQTPENPRPHERLERHFPPGMGVLELYGTEALGSIHDGHVEGAFGDRLGTCETPLEKEMHQAEKDDD